MSTWGVSAHSLLATSQSPILRTCLASHRHLGFLLSPNPQSGTDKRNDEDEPLTLEGEELVQRLQASASSFSPLQPLAALPYSDQDKSMRKVLS